MWQKRATESTPDALSLMQNGPMRKNSIAGALSALSPIHETELIFGGENKLPILKLLGLRSEGDDNCTMFLAHQLPPPLQ